MDLATAFLILKGRFKNHSAAASALGMTRDHYRALRNGRAHIPTRTAEYIILKAQEAATPAGDESEEGGESA